MSRVNGVYTLCGILTNQLTTPHAKSGSGFIFCCFCSQLRLLFPSGAGVRTASQLGMHESMSLVHVRGAGKYPETGRKHVVYIIVSASCCCQQLFVSWMWKQGEIVVPTFLITSNSRASLISYRWNPDGMKYF